MKQLEKEVFHRYQSILRELGLSSGVMPHFVKWVRYFLDYEAKYGDGAPRSRLIDGFIKKLASKGQSSSLRQQARRAVEAFLKMEAQGDGFAVAEERTVAEPLGENIGERAHSATSLRVEADPRRDWRETEAALAGEIKRRNYSPKTMKTYLT